MIYIKKLIFVPFFLVALAFTLYLLEPVLKSTDFVLSFGFDSFYQTLMIAGGLILTSLFFCIFVALTQDFKLILPAILIAVVLPIILIPGSLAYVLTIGFLISLLLESVLLVNKFKTYVTFSAPILLVPTIKTLVFFFTLTIAFGYYLNMNENIKKNGFKIPDKLLDSVIEMSMPKAQQQVQGARYLAQISQLTPEQIRTLKRQPELLKQYGITLEDLDKYFPASSTKSTTQLKSGDNPTSATQIQLPSGLNPKQLIKDQVESMIKPYEGFLAPIFAALLFSMLSSSAWILQLLLTPLVFLIFYVLEKTNFIRFIKEQREVKKMVV